MKIIFFIISIFIYYVSCEKNKDIKKPLVVVDVDAGADDAIALLMLLAAHKREEIELMAITCVAGNTNLTNVATNVLRLLEAASALNIPVFKGANEGLVPDPDYDLSQQEWHGKDGFGDLDYGEQQPPDLNQIKPQHAVNAIYSIISNSPKQVTVIFLGPLTNAALISKIYPDFFELVKDIFVMGGNYKGVGNKSNAAEFNFGMDPEAAYLIFRDTNKNITLLPWETCMEMSLTTDWRFHVMGNIENPEMKLMNAVEKSIYMLHNNDTSYLACDAAGVAVMLDPNVITKSFTTHATVELCGRFTRGQTVIDHNNLHIPNVKIVTQMDEDKFKEMLMVAAGHSGAEL